MEAIQARERQEEARRLQEQKCQDASEAKTVYTEANKCTLEKTEALEKHAKNGRNAGGDAGRPRRETSLKHSWSARRRRSGTSMKSLPNYTVRIESRKKDKHMHPLERTQSTRFCLLQHGKRVRRVVV